MACRDLGAAPGYGPGLGVPRLGTEASITCITPHPSGSGILVSYAATRRVKLLSLWQAAPYLVGAACPLHDDHASCSVAELAAIDDAEDAVWSMLQEASGVACSAVQCRKGMARGSPPVVG